jgi:hypothetical protein
MLPDLPSQGGTGTPSQASYRHNAAPNEEVAMLALGPLRRHTGPRRTGGRRAAHRAALGVAVVIILAAVLAACASGGGKAQLDQAAAPSAATEAARMGDSGTGSAQAPAPGGTDITNQYAAITDQRIVKTGEVTLQVTNVADASSQVRAMASALGGYVGGAQAGTLDESATLTLRIPAARFDDALSRLHEMGEKVLSENTQEQDVTASVVDLDARLKNLQASEAQYRTLMAKATKIEDILSVQSRLDDVQGQIEQLSAQLKQLTNQADLSTLTVTLQPQPEPIKAASSTWDPGETLSSAVGALLTVGQGLVTVGIWLAIVGLPILVVLSIAGLVVYRLGLLRRPAAPHTGLPEA